jgi:selenocysteine lyase/cysteine desulfurase
LENSYVKAVQVAEELYDDIIYGWDGNYYVLEVTKRLRLEDSDGMACVGPVHYNTYEEIRKFGEALGRITGPMS